MSREESLEKLLAKEMEKNNRTYERACKIMHSIELMGIDTKISETYQVLNYIIGMTDEIKLRGKSIT